MQKILVVFILLVVIFFTACKKDPKEEAEPVPPQEIIYSNDVKLNFTNVADNVVLQLMKDTNDLYPGMPEYINSNNDTFSIQVLRYYISNIKLKRPDGSYFTEPESYHLLDARDSTSCKFTLKNVPLENYTSIEFIIGVDSTRNCSGAQSGALDIANDMFWDWSQGYIFYKLEGYSSSGPNNFTSKNLAYHVGGFSWPNNNVRTITLPFSTALTVLDNKIWTIYMKVNVQEAWRNPVNIDFSTYYLATNSVGTKPLVSNYTDMFSVVAVK